MKIIVKPKNQSLWIRLELLNFLILWKNGALWLLTNRWSFCELKLMTLERQVIHKSVSIDLLNLVEEPIIIMLNVPI